MSHSAADQIARLQRRIEVLESQLGRRRVGIHDRAEFLRRAFEDAPIGMALVGLDERILEANAALCQMLGYRREQLLQLTVPAITHPADADVEVQPKGDMKEGGALSFVVEKRYLRADGSVLTGRLSVSALLDEQAKPAYFLGQLEDVTREREAEDALREREATLRALIESTSEIFCVVDSRGQVRYLSPNFQELLGWPVAGWIGQPFAALVVAEDQAEFSAALAKVLVDADHRMLLSLRLRDQAGAQRWFELAGRNRLAVQTLAGVVISLRDVNEQRSLQAQLSQAQRLDSLGRLAGGVAHDFNNMLGIILAMTEFLREDIATEDPRRVDVETIEATALRARDLTRQLLAVGRRDHGAAQTTDIHALLAAAARLLEKALGDDITLTLTLAAESGCVVIDPAHIEQMILNFASNARDAMPSGGRFMVTTRRRLLDARGPAGLAPGRYLELQFADTGVGMEADLREHIFDPFFTTKDPGRGTGLGLATIYGLVQQARGHVHVDSEPGRGTCFTVLLPEVEATPAPALAESEHRAESPGSGHILLLEDDPALRTVTARILRAGGYQVEVLADADEALARAHELSFDLLVTDVVMPRMSGPEFYRRLAALRGPVPVVFVSGYAKAAQSDLGDHPGFLAKPFTPRALLAKVGEVLTRGGLASTP